MIKIPQTVDLPMKMNERGSILVSGTSVTLDSLMACYHQGDSPEDIHQGFPTVPLTDIYAVIAYYLAHQDEVDAYLEQREQESYRIRTEVEANYTPDQKAHTEHLRGLMIQKRKDDSL